MSSDVMESSGRHTSLQSFCLGLVMMAGVLPYFFTDSDGSRGVALGLSLAIAFPLLLLIPDGVVARAKRPTYLTSLSALLFLSIVMYGTMRATYVRNDNYYILADIFHWTVELFGVAVVTRAACCGSARSSRQVMLGACFLTIVATLILVAGCYAGVVPYGGYFQGNSKFWHLKAGVNFPQIPLMILICIGIFGFSKGSFWRKLAWFTVAIAALLLVMTLKRTMWVSTVVSLGCVLMPTRWLRTLAITGAVAGILISSFVIVSKSSMFSSLDFMTYNDSYSVTDTMEDRQHQLSDAVKQLSVAGIGFGGETFIHNVGSNKVDRLHYVHSFYLFQMLQLGIPFAIFCFVYMAFTLFVVNREFVSLRATDWRVPASIACLVGLYLNGVSLVSFHSAFSGVAFGLALSAVGERSRGSEYSPLEN